MTITLRQKNIPNPAARTQLAGTAPGYDIGSPRNRWVLDALHIGFLTTGKFPKIGSSLAPLGELSDNSRRARGTLEDDLELTFQENDAKAYIACYPQNAILYWISNTQIVPAGEEHSLLELRKISEVPDIDKILTVSTPEAQSRINQGTITQQERGPEEKVSQLPAVMLTMTSSRYQKLLRTVGLENEPVLDQDVYLTLDTSQYPNSPDPAFSSLEDSINLDDWTRNVGPNQKANDVRIYYNSSYYTYHAVVRTNIFHTSDGFEDSLKREWKPKLFNDLALKFGISNAEMNSNTRDWIGQWEQEAGKELGTFELYYGDSDRPFPPKGSVPWLMGFKLTSEEFENIGNIDPDANLFERVAPKHPADIMSSLISSPEKPFRAPYFLDEVNGILEAAASTLKFCESKMHEEAVRPDDFEPENFNIKEEIIKLEELPNKYLGQAITEWEHQGIRTDGSAVEIFFNSRFQPQIVAIDGIILSTPVAGGQLSITYPLPWLGDSAKGKSKRTWAYFYYARELAQWNRHSTKPPWIELLGKYTYPSITYYPSTGQAARLKERGTAGKKDKTFQTSAQVKKSVLERMWPSNKEMMIAVTSAAGECDKALSKIAKESAIFYGYFTGQKVDWESAIRRAVTLAKRELVEDEILKAIITDLESYSANPAIIQRDIERAINNEIACALDMIGGVIQKQILDPAGAPPAVNSLARKALRPRISFSFSKSSSGGGFFKVWKKQLENMIIEFAKQMLLSILGDLVKAVLGCGPGTGGTAGDTDKQKVKNSSTYGLIQVNSLIGARPDINLSKVVKKAGIKYQDFVTVDEEKSSFLREPTLEEMKQFNDDASDILMAEEMHSLLAGDAKKQTHDLVLEMAKRIRVESLQDLSEEDKESKLVVDTLGDSLKEGDTKYAALNLTNENIRTYFSLIGDLLGNLENLLDNLDPEDAYCETVDPQVPGVQSGVDIGITNEQLIKQIDHRIQAKKDTILSLCEAGNSLGLPSFQNNLNTFMEAFDEPKFYKDFLSRISAVANVANDAIADALKSEYSAPNVAPTPPVGLTDTKLYAYLNRPWNEGGIGPRAYKPVCGVHTGGGIKWYIGDSTSGYIRATFRREGSRIRVTYDHHVPSGGGTDSVPRTIVAGNYASNDNRRSRYRQESQTMNSLIEPGTFLAQQTRERDDLLGNRKWLWNGAVGLYAPGMVDGTHTTIPRTTNNLTAHINNNIALAVNQSFGPNTGDGGGGNIGQFTTQENKAGALFIKRVSNRYYDIARSVTVFYASETGSRRFGKFSRSIASPAFVPNSDPCSSGQIERIAAAALDGIQQRIVTFLLNVGCMFSPYNGWMTPDIFNPIADYLSTKIKEDMVEKGVYAAYNESIEKIEKSMSRPLGSTTIDLNFEEIPSGEKFDYIVRQIYMSILDRIGRQTEYPAAATNFADQREAMLDLTNISQYFTVGNYALNIYDPDRGNWADGQEFPAVVDDRRVGNWPAEKGNSIDNSIANLDIDHYLWNPEYLEGYTPQRPNGSSAAYGQPWMNFIPVFQIVAMQIMYMDKNINIVGRYPQFKFYSSRRIAQADDALYQAINPAYIPKFSYKFRDFPVTINNIVYYSETQLNMQLDQLKNLRRLILASDEIKDHIREKLATAQRLLDEAEAIDTEHGLLNGTLESPELQIYIDALGGPRRGSNLLSATGEITELDLTASDRTGRFKLRGDRRIRIDNPDNYVQDDGDGQHATWSVKEYLRIVDKWPTRPYSGPLTGAKPNRLVSMSIIEANRYTKNYDDDNRVYLPDGRDLRNDIEAAYEDVVDFSLGNGDGVNMITKVGQARDILKELVNPNSQDPHWQQLYSIYRQIIETVQDNSETSISHPNYLGGLNWVKNQIREDIVLKVGQDPGIQLPLTERKLTSLINQIESFLEQREVEMVEIGPGVL